MAKFELDDAPTKKSKPTGWLAAAVVLILAGGFAGAYYLPLKTAHGLLMNEHEALAKKTQELDSALKSSGADLKTTLAEREKLKQALKDASDKEAEYSKEVDALRASIDKAFEKHVSAKYVTIESAPAGAAATAKSNLLFRPNTAKTLPFASKFACSVTPSLLDGSRATVTVEVAPTEDKDGFAKASEQAAVIADLLRTSCKLSANQVDLAVRASSPAGAVTLRVETTDKAPAFSPATLLN